MKEIPKEKIIELSWILSFPVWILKRWLGRFERDIFFSYCKDLNGTPPIYLRVNCFKCSVNELRDRFKEKGVQVRWVRNSPMLMLESFPYEVLGSFLEEGLCSVQDKGSFEIVQAIKARPGEVGLDACAGHGGKASAVAELLNDEAKIFVYDPSEKKNLELKKNFQRLGLTVPFRISGVGEVKEKKLKFDWILIDAPCSGLGTLGRKPEIRWRTQRKDLKRFQKKQEEILERWSPFVKEGGRMVYSVCSMEPEEGERVIERFLTRQPEFRKEKESEMGQPKTGQDNFYWCRLKKKAK